ncbi:LysM peptidoglycan-binding domain-containing protein [Chitinophaga flava]|uniref:LysM domain-containing protein n=1 Tax=Chitinophaga flava TaxID=2259036 RepID=A0A365XSK4_9BACT|nr:LysM domain-containing protein [Chitinophaga flava]RBL89313.1 hypothetical protein DF182_22590 [Chitinophaga flava]
MTSEEIDSLSDASEDSNQEIFDGLLDDIEAFLDQQQEIRILITGSRNFGHQATCVNIVKRLVSYSENILYSFCLYYRSEEERLILIDTLQLLMPQFVALDQPFKLLSANDSNNIQVIDVITNIPQEIFFGLTGGFDEDERHDQLPAIQACRVQYFMQLQPYLWYLGEEEFINVNTQKATRLNVYGQEQGVYLHRSSYFCPTPVTLSPFDLQVLNNSPYQVKLQIVQYLAGRIDNNLLNLCSVYGIGTLGESAGPLYNLCASISFAQDAQDLMPSVQLPCVLLLFQEESLTQWNICQNLVNDQNWNLLQGTDAPSQPFKAFHAQYRISQRVFFLGGPENIPDLNTVQQRVNALQNGQTLIIYFGKVPQVLFDYCFFKSTFPPFLEGQATAATVFNFGCPFFKYSKGQDDIRFDYPTLPLSRDESSVGAGNRRESAAAIFTCPSQWIMDSGDFFPVIQIFDIIVAAFDDEPDIYFQALKEFFNNVKNDKLLLAMDMVLKLLGRRKSILATAMQLAADNAKLIELYGKLEGQTTVNLPAALGPGFLTNWLLKASSKNAVIVNEAVSAINDTQTEVTLNGKTSSFTIPGLQVDFVFTENNDELVMVLTMHMPGISFSGAQWFQFPNNSTVKMTLDPTSLLPAQGKLSTTLKAGITMTISLDIPSQKDVWTMQTVFADDMPDLNDIFQFVGGINLRALLPTQLAAITAIKLTNLGFQYNYKTNTLEDISIGASTPDTATWKLVPGVELQKMSMNIGISNPGNLKTRKTRYGLGGQFGIGDGTVTVDARFPPVRITGQIAPDSKPIAIKTIIAEYLGEDFATALPASIRDIAIIELSFGLDQPAGSYNFAMGVAANWTIPVAGVDIFTITQLAFSISAVSQLIDNDSAASAMALAVSNQKTTDITGKFGGAITILPGTASETALTVAAAYLGTGKGWTFTATQTAGQISLIELFTFYLPPAWKPDTSQFDIAINGLGITIATITNSWMFTGKTATPIRIPGLDIDINLILTAGYNGGPKPEDIGYFGALSAEVKWQNIALTVFYNFKPGYTSYGIRWGRLEGKIEDKNGKQIATLSFTESTSIGSIVELMIGWATGSTFSLSSPWNILNAIPLNNLSLEYNFTDKQVGINVNIGPIEMGFARIEAIKVTYKSNQPKPEDNGVIVELTGSFRWQDDPKKPLGWDAARPETTPAPQGQGNKYLDLRLLAMGQHVTLPCFATAENVQMAIDCMKKLPTPDNNNITIPPVTLDANSSWITGMDFGILRFGDDKKDNGAPPAKTGYLLTMQIIFNDPNLYALRIKLDGEAAKVFQGLDFQIMYKKVTDTIGLYKAEIALPDKMRFIRMGQFNITLPIFGIEYYTNGDFQVDLGFPWKADFSRSFSFQALIWTPIGIPIPVMGSVGIYFGKLSSATTNRVPKTDDGTFNPVLVFGFGIQFGLGYSFDAGILKAGFSLTLVAIVEGLLAKFNPYSLTAGGGTTDQLETSYYFKVTGTVGIIGKLFGTVDFAIIKAEVNVDIRILASFTFAPYEDIVLNLSASVEISVSISINLGLFKIKISFSFSAKISQTVKVKGIGGTPPWRIATTNGAVLLANRRIRVRQARMLQSVVTLNWRNLTAATVPYKLTAYLGLGLTMAGDQASQVSQQLACYVAMLFIQSVPGPERETKVAAAAGDTSFETLAKMVFRWVVAAMQPTPVSPEQVDELLIHTTDLQQVLAILNDPDTTAAFSNDDISYFLKSRFNMEISPATGNQETDATYFPLAPDMKLSLPAYGSSYPELSYTFEEYNKTSSDYRKFLRNYFDQLAVNARKESDRTALLALNDANSPSMGSFVFNDYFLMISRQIIQTAIDSLQEFKYLLKDTQSVQDIINTINRGAGLSGSESFTVEELFADNNTVVLNANKKIVISGATYLVQAKDTFNSIAGNSNFAASFTGTALATLNQAIDNTLNPGVVISYPGKDPYVVLPSQSLNTVAASMKVSTSDLISKGGVPGLADLPLPVATLLLPDFTYNTQAGDTLQSIAAKFHLDPALLAAPAANSQIVALFDSSTTPTLDIANLTRYKVGDLLQEIQDTRGLQQLSGMTSRYYMAGLRLPTSGITPEKKGMWVSGNQGSYQLPDFAGLYALTGQQFPIPGLNSTDAFDISMLKNGVDWVSFTGTDPQKLTISIKPNSDEAKQITLVKNYAVANKLQTGMVFNGTEGMFNTKKATWSFTTEIVWSAASLFSMPYSIQPPGTPGMQLWMMPDPLMELPDPDTRKINPRITMKVGEYNDALRGMVDTPLTAYGYASVVAFTVKQVPVNIAAPATQTTYEVMGADGSSANILERIVSGIGNNNQKIHSLILAYNADPNSTTANGIQTDNAGAITMGLAQVNLSTDTRPDTTLLTRKLSLAPGDNMTLLNDKTGFIRLLWEASITRAGGFYLYYYNSDNNSGLPDRIFNDKGEASLSLIVLYEKEADTNTQNTVTNYMNAVVTTQSIDPNRAVLYAEANPVANLSIAADNVQTLALLSQAYYANAATLAKDNDRLLLRQRIQIQVTAGTYEVGPDAPGGSLSSIAAFFGTTVDAIKAANPAQQNWPDPLPMYTAIYLPAITVSVNINMTLADIVHKYGVNLTSLANSNSDVAGLFADNQQVKINSGPFITSSTVPQGVISWQAVRPKPADIPDNLNAPDYGKTFLLNMFSLLSYQVYDNVYFGESKLGLPANPATPQDEQQTLSKVRTPRLLAEGEDWLFNVQVPYSQFTKKAMANRAADLPDASQSPYKGLGYLLQIDFAWQDLYGNRLITELSNPAAGAATPLNRPPVITGYNDALLALTQWPSVSSVYNVQKVPNTSQPAILLALTFDATVYQGMISASATSSTIIKAVFTQPLNKVSAETKDNYQLDHGITVVSAVLDTDLVTVTLTVSNIPEKTPIQLSINNITDQSSQLTFQGTATFFHPSDAGASTSSIRDKAAGDLQTYTQLWYQLTDPAGIRYRVITSMTEEVFDLGTGDVTSLVDGWLADIWKFVNDRAQAQTNVAPPSATHNILLPMNTSKLNKAETYPLQLSFTIERTGGVVMGDLSTTGNIRLVSSVLSPFAGKAGDMAAGLAEFAASFEATMQQTGVYQLKVAAGTDREASLTNAAGNQLWVVRLGLNKDTSISYSINQKTPPLLFAPKPVSTQLQTRKAVPIWDFNPDKGIDFNAPPDRTLDFAGIDMDVWTQSVFGDIDNLLTSEYVAAIQLVDNQQQATFLQTMLDNKSALANLVKSWMTFVFDGESGSQLEIQEAFRQQLLVRLSNAYTVKAGVQYAATVVAGDFRLFFVNIDPKTTNTILVQFTSDIGKTVAEDISNYQLTGGIKVVTATADTQNAQFVALQLSAQPVAGNTQLSVKSTYTSAGGAVITGPLTMPVSAGAAATPSLMGNVIQVFRLLGAVKSAEDPKKLLLFFSEVPDPSYATNPAKYVVSGITVNSAMVDPGNAQVVVLVLAAEPIVGETMVNVLPPYLDTNGDDLMPRKDTVVTNEIDVSHRTEGINITSARLNLKNSNAVPLPFLVTAPQLIRNDAGAVISYIDLDTVFSGSSIEHQIAYLPNIADYRASSWLNFMNTPASLQADLGTARVPMILRAFPVAPAMTDQTGDYLVKNNTDLSDILFWSYNIHYSRNFHYPQDEIFFTISFNVIEDNQSRLAAMLDAFAELAEFITVYPQIAVVFSDVLMKIDAATTDVTAFQRSAVALKSFNTMTGRIIQAASDNGLSIFNAQGVLYSATEVYQFRLQEGTGTVDTYTDILVVTITGLPASGMDNPKVMIPGFTTRIYTGDSSPDSISYYFEANGKPLDAATGQTISARIVQLPLLNLFAKQNIRTVAEMKRNNELVPGRPTAPDFIYTTGEVGFTDIFNPLLEYNLAVDIATATGSKQKTTLKGQLKSLFDVLLKNNKQDLLSFLMSCSYAYQLNNDINELSGVQLPVVMQPLQTIRVIPQAGNDTFKSLDVMIDNWTNSIKLWAQTHQPDIINGVLFFKLSVFSNLNEDVATVRTLPLLRMGGLFLSLNDVTDWPS